MMNSLLKSIVTKKTILPLLCLLLISIATVGLPQRIFGNTTIKDNNCGRLPIDKVITNVLHQYNKAKNAIDGKLHTLLTADGAKQYIQADLGSEKSLCDIKVAWINGDKHMYKFTISVSVDGINFLDILKGKSSGKTLSPEKYDFPKIDARYLKITTDEKPEKNRAGISELSVDGQGCRKLNIIAISSTSSIPSHAPQNLIDNNPNTRWSNFGTGSSVQFDLGNSSSICSVDISWYRGNIRQNSFEISASNDGLNFTKVFIGKSSSKTLSPERYDFPKIDARYLKITINGNTENKWASINEVSIDGMQNVSSQPRETTPPIKLSKNSPPTASDIDIKTDVNKAIKVTLAAKDPDAKDKLKFSVVEAPKHGKTSKGPTSDSVFYTPDPGFSGTDVFTFEATDSHGAKSKTAVVNVEVQKTAEDKDMDQFGIKEIYPTKSHGEEWFMDMKNPNDDGRTDPQTKLTKNSDGSWKVTDNKVRYGVFTSSGYHPESIKTLDQKKLESQGYMQSPNDWKNIEMTGYVKFNKGTEDDSWTWYARGGRHTGSGAPEGCEGTAYKQDLFFDGNTRFAKEQWHVHYLFTDSKDSGASSIDKFVGFKAVFYNEEHGGKTDVKLEMWLDKNADNNWKKVDEFTDSGGFGDAGSECGGKKDQIITWGGPIATFRWDNVDDADIKDLSVREIEPPK